MRKGKLQLDLPWPPRALSPNARPHYMAKYHAAKKYKTQCYMLAKGQRITFTDQDIHLSITFHPKTKNTPDIDNCIASIKAGLDGIAAAWKVNDSKFRLQAAIGEPVKGGKVVVQL